MGRTYVVEEAVGRYLSSVSLGGKASVSGLLIGQPSPQKDYVILAARTPAREEPSEKSPTRPAALDSSVDEEWVAAHACQVSRMLPGGLLVLGVFLVTAAEAGSELQHALRRLIFAVGRSLGQKRLWHFTDEETAERAVLHICSSTKKISCRTYDIQDPKSSAKPADWKYQSRLSASWLSLECTLDVNLHIPLSAAAASCPLEKNTKNGLARWAQQIENGVYLINGQVKDEDSDLVEGQKKSRGNTQAASPSFDVRVLRQLLLSPDHRSTATVQVCSGSVNLRGAVKCRAYLHGNRPKVKDALQAVKRDILNTLADRCDLLFEELLLNESPEGKAKSPQKETHVLPLRVFVPIPGSTVMLCDYKFADDSAEEIRDHFADMLDHSFPAEDLEVAEEVSPVCLVSSATNPEAPPDSLSVQQSAQPSDTTIVLKIQQNLGMIAALAVAAVAAGVSFHYFSD
ncbi:protein odr-4 homolog [Sorex fumeus]|uniref:protein odr-4 homolog n=1 Tax=Sorex fumeus TaxID=62283 RepID=UPI0024AD07E6|nr:protein odr-4 homolog [Sorex fumeus]